MRFELIPGQCLVVAEVAQSHDGSLGTAHAYIDAIAKAGADAVKFQTHIAAAESSPDEPWRVVFSRQDKSRYDYWRRMEFTEEQWAGLERHATECGLLFLSSPFSVEAAQLLHRIGIPAWKIASGEISNTVLLDYIANTRLPVLISSGMSSLAETDRIVDRFKQYGVPMAVMQCTSKYPCPPREVGLNMIETFRQRYAVPVGLSDHSGTIYPSLAAAVLGAEIVEVHVTLSREAFGPDVSASVTTGELKQLVSGIDFITKMVTAPVDKDAAAAEMADMRQLFTKSVVTLSDLPPGTAIERQHLGLRKPARGIPADKIETIIGRRVAHHISAGEFLQEADLVGAVRGSAAAAGAGGR